MEKIYLAMKRAGITNIVLGVLLAVSGVVTIAGSVLLFISGSKLLNRKKDLMI